MYKYYVNKNAQNSGEHEVHREDCGHLPNINNRIYLGYFSNCEEAVATARSFYDNVDGCMHCSRECHTR